MQLRKHKKTPVYHRVPFTGLKTQRRSRKKRVLTGLAGAVVAIVAGAFVKDKERHQ